VQLRRDYKRFLDQEAEILVVGPENPSAFKIYWRQKKLPFIGLPDPKHTILKIYGQEVNLFKLGRMPAQVFVDKAGKARFVHYGHSMQDIPDSKELLALLSKFNQSEQNETNIEEENSVPV